MTVASNANTITAGVTVGLTVTRESVPGIAARLAHDLFYCTQGDPYKYLSAASAKEEFTKTIGNYLHVILNQIGVDGRECKHCGGTQQDHEWIGGWCNPGNHTKFEAK